MGKTYIKVSGTWTAIKKIYVKVSGVWKEAKKVFSNVSGVWKEVHSGAVEYTFASSITATSSTGILLSSYVNPASADEFIITVNSGVTLKGMAGRAGANNNSAAIAQGNVGTRICKNSIYTDGRTVSMTYAGSRSSTHYSYYYTGNGGSGTAGSPALNLTGFGGKKVTIINNGTIQGGAGGNAGAGARSARDFDGACSNSEAYACGASGSVGAGGAGIYNPNSATLVTSGNTVLNGSSGSMVYGWSFAGMNNIGSCCFTKEAKVMLFDGSTKNIEDVKVGDVLLGVFGEPNRVTHTQRPNGSGLKLYDVNGVVTTSEHGIVNGNRDGFVYVSLEDAKANVGSTQEAFNGKEVEILTVPTMAQGVKTEQIDGKSVYTTDGSKQAEVKELGVHQGELYHLLTDGGSRTFAVDGVFVSGWCDGVEFLKLSKSN